MRAQLTLERTYYQFQLASRQAAPLYSRLDAMLSPERVLEVRQEYNAVQDSLEALQPRLTSADLTPLVRVLQRMDSLLLSQNQQTAPQEQIRKTQKEAGTLFEEVRQSTAAWRISSLRELGQLYLYIGLAFWIACIGLGAWIAAQLTRPIRILDSRLKRFVDSNFQEISEEKLPGGMDEFTDLAKQTIQLQKLVRERMHFFREKVQSRTDELADANDQLLRIAEANSRFVPDEFLDHLDKEGIEEVSLGDHVEREMTIMFTDIREFTQLSESLNPQENFDFINSYLRGIVPIIQRHGGFIDKFIGDSVMALFPESAEGAVRAAFGIEEFLEVFNARLRSQGRAPVRTGTGIHTGHLILGTIGHANRLETTVISDAVNTAARVEGLSKHYQAKVVITEASLATIKNPRDFAYRFLDRVQVKGKSRAVEVYEFLSPSETEKRASLSAYNKAIGLIRERRIREAFEILERLEADNPADDAIRIMAQRCRAHFEEGDNAWDDITQIIS